MKKALVGIAVLAVALIAVNAHAGFGSIKDAARSAGAPSEVTNAVGDASGQVVSNEAQKIINDANCSFEGKTATITCKRGTFDDMLTKLSQLNTGSKAFAGKRIKIDGTVWGPNTGPLKGDRRDAVQDKMRDRLGSKWWNVYFSTRTDSNNNNISMKASTLNN